MSLNDTIECHLIYCNQNRSRSRMSQIPEWDYPPTEGHKIIKLKCAVVAIVIVVVCYCCHCGCCCFFFLLFFVSCRRRCCSNSCNFLHIHLRSLYSSRNNLDVFPFWRLGYPLTLWLGHRVASQRLVSWYGTGRNGMSSWSNCDIISYHIISYHIISYHIIHIISYHIISYHIISYHIIWFQLLNPAALTFELPKVFLDIVGMGISGLQPQIESFDCCQKLHNTSRKIKQNNNKKKTVSSQADTGWATQ